jgi:hypothetical protein
MNDMTIRNIHTILSNSLPDSPKLSGALRRETDAIGGTVCIPLANYWTIKELFKILIQKAAEIEEPFELALFTMTHPTWR